MPPSEILTLLIMQQYPSHQEDNQSLTLQSQENTSLQATKPTSQQIGLDQIIQELLSPEEAIDPQIEEAIFGTSLSKWGMALDGIDISAFKINLLKHIFSLTKQDIENGRHQEKKPIIMFLTETVRTKVISLLEASCDSSRESSIKTEKILEEPSTIKVFIKNLILNIYDPRNEKARRRRLQTTINNNQETIQISRLIIEELTKEINETYHLLSKTLIQESASQELIKALELTPKLQDLLINLEASISKTEKNINTIDHYSYRKRSESEKNANNIITRIEALKQSLQDFTSRETPEEFLPSGATTIFENFKKSNRTDISSIITGPYFDRNGDDNDTSRTERSALEQFYRKSSEQLKSLQSVIKTIHERIQKKLEQERKTIMSQYLNQSSSQ